MSTATKLKSLGLMGTMSGLLYVSTGCATHPPPAVRGDIGSRYRSIITSPGQDAVLPVSVHIKDLQSAPCAREGGGIRAPLVVFPLLCLASPRTWAVNYPGLSYDETLNEKNKSAPYLEPEILKLEPLEFEHILARELTKAGAANSVSVGGKGGGYVLDGSVDFRLGVYSHGCGLGILYWAGGLVWFLPGAHRVYICDLELRLTAPGGATIFTKRYEKELKQQVSVIGAMGELPSDRFGAQLLPEALVEVTSDIRDAIGSHAGKTMGALSPPRPE